MHREIGVFKALPKHIVSIDSFSESDCENPSYHLTSFHLIVMMNLVNLAMSRKVAMQLALRDTVRGNDPIVILMLK